MATTKYKDSGIPWIGMIPEDWEVKRLKEILYTYEDCSDKEYQFHKKHKLIMGEMNYGKGRIIISTLSCLDGCVSYNPVLDKLLLNIIEGK